MNKIKIMICVAIVLSMTITTIADTDIGDNIVLNSGHFQDVLSSGAGSVPAYFYPNGTIFRNNSVTIYYHLNASQYSFFDTIQPALNELSNNDTIDREQVNLTFETLSNKSTNINLGTSDILYPTQNATKSYVDSHITALNDTLSNTSINSSIMTCGSICHNAWYVNYTAFNNSFIPLNNTVNSSNRTSFSLEYMFDNQGSTIPENSNFWLSVPYYADIYEIHVTTDVITSAIINVTKAAAPTGGAVPSFYDITGGNNIILASQGSLTNTTLTGWTKNITNDDLIKINIYSIDNATKITVAIDGRKQ